MNTRTKGIVKTYILEYLCKKFPNINIKAKDKLFICPFGQQHEGEWDKKTCNIFPPNSNMLYCHDPKCGKLGDIFDIVRKLEPDMKELNNDDIADYLINYLDIQTDEETDKLLDMYFEYGFCLFPLKKQGQGDKSKQPIQSEWEKTEIRDIRQWKDWLKANSGLALNLGEKSGVIAIDIDDEKTYEQLKDKLGNTLIQKTKRGFHYLYSYDKDFDHINHINLRNKGYEMEIRANNAYIVIAPTSVEGEKRSWNNESIKEMPKELKEFLLNLVDKPKEEIKDDIQDAIDNNRIEGIKGLDGRCNNTFITMGGILRKQMRRKDVELALNVFNNSLDDPMDKKTMKSMIEQIDKYNTFDKKEVSDKIISHLQRTRQASARDIQAVLGYELEDIHQALEYLIKEDKISLSRNLYSILETIEWKDQFVKESKLLDFKVPYFDEYATFRDSDLIILGGGSGVGKTYLAVNFIQKFSAQGVKPYYISTEPGNRFSQIAMALGLKEGDFYWYNHYSPENVELPDNSVTIVDWLLPDCYADTDKLYKQFARQLDKHGGLCIIFAQMKTEDEFYAHQMTQFFASLCAIYKYQKNDDGSVDNENTYFETKKIRESKVGKQIVVIPTKYNRETKEVELRK